MKKCLNILGVYPELGAISSVGGSLLPFIRTSTPYLQYTGLIIGLAIGVLTLYVKWMEAKKKFNENDNNKNP